MRVGMCRFVWLAAAAAAVCSGAQAQRGTAGIAADGQWVRENDLAEVGEYYALVIGIDDYRHPDWKLQCAVNDAQAVAQLLRDDYGFHVTELYNRDATLMRIREELGKLGDVLTHKDSLLIYYAGHGALERKTGYWIPADARPGRRWTYLENVVIRNFLRVEQVRARHVLLVSDSCYAGALLRETKVEAAEPPAHVTDALRTPSRECLTSGGIKPVADGMRGGHSVFARYFLKALRNPPRAAFLPTEIAPKLVENVRRNSHQNPALGRLRDCGDEVGGAFVFFYRKGTAQHPATFGFTLRSHPTGAQVLVDDQPRGTTPFEAELEIGKPYRITVSKPGRSDWERRVVWTKSDALELVARLRPAGGRDTRLQIALDYIKRGHTAVGLPLLRDVAKSDSPDSLRALAFLFTQAMKEDKTSEARTWADELRKRFPATVESNEADKALFDHAVANAGSEKNIVGLRARIAARRGFVESNAGNAFVAQAEAEIKAARERQLALYRSACAAKQRVARDFIELAQFDAARTAAKQIETLLSDARQLDRLTLDRPGLDDLRKEIDSREVRSKQDQAFAAVQRSAHGAEGRRDYAGAIKAYEQFVRDERGNLHVPQAEQELARLRGAKARFESEQYQGAIRLARAAQEREDLDEIAKQCEVALRYRPEDGDALKLLATVKPYLWVTASPTSGEDQFVVRTVRASSASSRRTAEATLTGRTTNGEGFHADVYIDGRKVGVTPLRWPQVDRGRTYRVSVRAAKLHAPAQEVQIARFGRVPVHFDLKESALPPGFEKAFMLPDSDKDQHGNPVVTRGHDRGRSPHRGPGSAEGKCDPQTGWPYEIWLQRELQAEVEETEEYEVDVQKGLFFKRTVKEKRTRLVRRTKPVLLRMELVLIPAGEFMMGSENGFSYEKPVHKVRITQAFYVGKYEVTQAQYEAIAEENPSRFKGPANPVHSVSWNECAAFCKTLSDRAGVAVVLPTEAQWEYASRAGTRTRFSFGDSESQLRDYAWYSDNSGGKTHPAGQKRPNPWGLYDMHGNVWEWCVDGMRSYSSSSQTDPRGSGSGQRVFRGGSWRDEARYVRSANRDVYGRTYANSIFGFRVLCVFPLGR